VAKAKDSPSAHEFADRRRLILIGPSGSGKTVVADRVCSRLTDWRLIDSDDEVKALFGADRVTNIFEEEGELAFRSAELKIAQRLKDGPQHVVVATGGGLPATPQAMPALLAAGLTVYLRASLNTLWRRIQRDRVKREDLPMLKDGGIELLEKLVTEREPTYERAHLVVDTDSMSVDGVVETLCGIAETILSTRGPMG
jgi:shikimate kinase